MLQKNSLTTEHLEGHPQQRPGHRGLHRLLQVRRRLHGRSQVRVQDPVDPVVHFACCLLCERTF